MSRNLHCQRMLVHLVRVNTSPESNLPAFPQPLPFMPHFMNLSRRQRQVAIGADPRQAPPTGALLQFLDDTQIQTIPSHPEEILPGQLRHLASEQYGATGGGPFHPPAADVGSKGVQLRHMGCHGDQPPLPPFSPPLPQPPSFPQPPQPITTWQWMESNQEG